MLIGHGVGCVRLAVWRSGITLSSLDGERRNSFDRDPCRSASDGALARRSAPCRDRSRSRDRAAGSGCRRRSRRRPALAGMGRNDELRKLRRLKRRTDRRAHGGIAGRRPHESGARVETGSERAEVALVCGDRVVNVARGVAVIAEHSRTLGLADLDRLSRRGVAGVIPAGANAGNSPSGPNGPPMGCASAMTWLCT